MTHVAEREGERYLDRVRRWLGGANMHIHALRLGEEDVVDYAIAHTKRSFGERFDRFAPQVIEWITNLRAQRFRRMIGTVLTFVWNEESPLPPWTQEDEAKPPRRPIAPELERLLNAKHRARKLDPRDLDAVRVMVPDDVVLTERFRPAGGAFEPYEFRVNLRGSAISPSWTCAS